MLESRISAVEQLIKLLGWENPHTKTVVWSGDMEGHAKKCVDRYCELANKTIEQMCKVSTPCLDDHHFTKGRIGNGWRIIQSLISNCLDRHVLGQNW